MIDNNTTVSTTELALILGLSVRRVQQLIQDGTIERVSVGRVNLRDGIRQYLQSVEVDPKELELDEIKVKKKKAEAEYKQAKADIMELEARELKNRLLPAEEVKACTEELIEVFNNTVRTLPEKIAKRGTPGLSPAEWERIIREEVFSTLQELASYTFPGAEKAFSKLGGDEK